MMPNLTDLIADLQLAKEIAIQNGNANSLVTATMAQAKLLGLDKAELPQETATPVKVMVSVKDARKYADNIGETIQ